MLNLCVARVVIGMLLVKLPLTSSSQLLTHAFELLLVAYCFHVTSLSVCDKKSLQMEKLLLSCHLLPLHSTSTA